MPKTTRNSIESSVALLILFGAVGALVGWWWQKAEPAVTTSSTAPYAAAAATMRQEYDAELASLVADHSDALCRLAEEQAANSQLLTERNALLEERDTLLADLAQAQRALEELREIDGEAACRLADKINPVWSFSFAFGQGFARGRAGRTDVPTTAEVGRAMLDSVLSVVPSETAEPWQPKDPLPDAGRSPASLDPGVWPRSIRSM